MKRFLFSLAGLSFALGVAAQLKPDIYTCRLGVFRVTTLCDSGQSRGKTDLLIGATPEMIRQYMPDETYATAINAFLVQAPGQTILVDTGLGAKLFDNLAAAGVAPEEIDVVFLTHMHGDHIGGMLRDGAVAFPNAAIFLSQREHDYWTSDEAMNGVPENRRNGFRMARVTLDAYKGRVKLIEPVTLGAKGGEEFRPGIQAVAAYGHTPGHTILRLESDGRRMLIWGDLVHAAAIQMPYPQVSLMYDVDPAEAAEIRKKVLEYANDNACVGAGMHLPYPGMLSLQQDHNGGFLHALLAKP